MLRRLAHVLTALLIAACAGTTPALAQETIEQGTGENVEAQDVPIRVAIIDLNRIRQESTAMQGVRRQMEEYRSSIQSDVQKEEEQLRKADQELRRKRTILSAEAFEEERRKFGDMLADVQRNLQKRKTDLEEANDKATAQIQNTLNKIIAEMAQQRKITLVLRRDQTVLSARALEVTDEVLARLNEQLPRVEVPNPGE